MSQINQHENIEFERITVKVESSGATVNVNHTTKTGHKQILGIALTTTDEDALTGTTMRMVLDNNIEIFNSDFEPRLIFTGKDCPMSDRFYPYVNRKIDQTPVDVTYKDGGNASAYPYYTYVYLVTNATK